MFMIQPIKSLFNFDPIAMIMLTLILFIGTCVGSFSLRYMKGDSRYGMFFFYLSLLIISIGMLACADHLLLFFTGWCVSNILLVRLMIHKSSWKAARNSGILAAKNYFFGAVCVASALLMLNFETGETSIKALTQHNFKPSVIIPTLLLLMIGGMTQSGIWPFHRWLVSSLNSPTPVSAIMHAGLVNGGGFLIARFAPLFLGQSHILNVIFLIGITTAIIGTFYKLLQSNIKQMLAFSTMGQMGFMIAQCGLGLFPAAIAHLTTHGMFKAYLFLASGSAAQEKRHKTAYPPKAFAFMSCLICGLLGSYCFSITSGKLWLSTDTTLVLTVIVFLTASQSALSILSLKMQFGVLVASIVTSVLCLAYGSVMSLMIKIMQPTLLMTPQPLNLLHIAAIILLMLSWLSILFFKNISKINPLRPWVMRGYVTALNKSQPHPKTVTSCRNHYKYL